MRASARRFKRERRSHQRERECMNEEQSEQRQVKYYAGSSSREMPLMNRHSASVVLCYRFVVLDLVRVRVVAAYIFCTVRVVLCVCVCD